MSQTGCYEVYITTPEGRDYHSSEFAGLPTVSVLRPSGANCNGALDKSKGRLVWRPLT
jgi:hypothetical protein